MIEKNKISDASEKYRKSWIKVFMRKNMPTFSVR